MATHEASYVTCRDLEERAARAYDLLASCSVCPRACGVNRLSGEPGYCGGGLLPKVSSYGPHFGEEPVLVGQHGSGTVFLSGCNMRCDYCQNYMISQCGQGTEISCEALAAIMLELQGKGCHNINFVSPTHYVPQLLKSLDIAASQGLSIPLVYNTGSYDSVDTLKLLDGVIDIYMPDTKYGRDTVALGLSHAPGYTGIMKAAIREMHRQVGDLTTARGLAVRGLIIRHLLLPGALSDSEAVLKFIAEEISVDSYVNIMDQYRPMWRILHGDLDPVFGDMRRPATPGEYRRAIACAGKYGLHRGFTG